MASNSSLDQKEAQDENLNDEEKQLVEAIQKYKTEKDKWKKIFATFPHRTSK